MHRLPGLPKPSVSLKQAPKLVVSFSTVKTTKLFSSKKTSSFQLCLFSTSHPKLTDFPTDQHTNVSSAISDKIGRNIHMIPKHPINTIKTLIQKYFENPATIGKKVSFNKFDTLPPFVTVEANFDSLLIPKDHVSRSPTDTYYVNKDILLRTHTSAHQTDLLKKGEKAFLVSGDVYRRDEIDATHYPVFHQMEGLRIFSPDELPTNDEEKTKFVAEDMKKSLEGIVAQVFGEPLQTRWVDAYFPFTEPSWELEIFYREKWLEVLGCGVVNQQIMKNCGLGDSRGWAFGIGLERLALVLFDIPDIRLFWSSDSRFLSQFESGKVVKFKPYSKYPPCYKDVAFWISPKFHPNDLFEIVRSIAGDLVESVSLLSTFTHPKTNRESHCYRINYRSMDKSLTNDEINLLQDKFRKEVVEKLGVELR